MLKRSVILLTLTAALAGCALKSISAYDPARQPNRDWAKVGRWEGENGREANPANASPAQRDGYSNAHRQGLMRYCSETKEQFDRPVCRTTGMPANRG